MANPLGVLLANLISPQIVTQPENVVYLNALIAIPGVLVGILATVGITRSEPKIPPTISAGQHHFGFLKGFIFNHN